jgi:hypothetical protein
MVPTSPISRPRSVLLSERPLFAPLKVVSSRAILFNLNERCHPEQFCLTSLRRVILSERGPGRFLQPGGGGSKDPLLSFPNQARQRLSHPWRVLASRMGQHKSQPIIPTAAVASPEVLILTATVSPPTKGRHPERSRSSGGGKDLLLSLLNQARQWVPQVSAFGDLG